MTGYGKGEAVSATRKITIEIKSVNGRYLDINMRLPRSLAFVEDTVKKCVTSKLTRGTVDIFYTYELSGESDKKAELDISLAKCYIEAGKQLEELGLNNDISAKTLVKIPDVVKISAADEDTDEVTALFKEAAEKAVEAFDAMRTKEGAVAKEDFATICGNIENTLEKVKVKAPLVVTEYKEKLEKRIAELLGKAPVDETRIATECALFADKCDINEEINRLGSHIKQFYSILESDAPQGRKLDFLSQEMNREINTMGSKANDLELTNYVIYMKNELEKIREQIRNVE